MELLFLAIGVALAIAQIYIKDKSLKTNIIKRFLCIFGGIATLIFLDKTYFKFSIKALVISTLIGLAFMSISIIMAKGIKLRKDDINSGLIYTSLLIYFIELPAEELLYRGMIFISLLKLSNIYIAVIISSLVFLGLHLKTWNDKFVWLGSFLLAIICAVTVYLTNSIWTAIIIHNLNDFGFITLVNKTNIFKKESSN